MAGVARGHQEAALKAASAGKPAAMQLSAAYAVCRGITRNAAKNFYYAFMVLPREKRNALSAVYAFMRHSDDISDDPAVSAADKTARLATWRSEMHRVLDGGPTDEPILFALADAQRRFAIRVELLDLLITGTEMDVGEPATESGPRVLYRNFEELQRYCYHVASVVGLICIRVFGYRDPKAEPLAERCGIAFQLTNIIRDVKEDALMGRVYLPLEDLTRFHRAAGDFSAARLNNGFEAERLRPVLELEAQRAREFYGAADDLVPLIDEDCRAALWVLVEIYRRLLEKIAARGYDVFGEKVRLTTAEKLAVMSKGFWRRIVA